MWHLGVYVAAAIRGGLKKPYMSNFFHETRPWGIFTLCPRKKEQWCYLLSAWTMLPARLYCCRPCAQDSEMRARYP